MSEMIERAARAVARTYSRAGEEAWRNWEPHARAAIAAMREPTEAMMVHAAKSDFIQWQSRPSAYSTTMKVAWQAAIDEALK